MIPRALTAGAHQISLTAALAVAASCDGGPVTYLILTLRLNGFGGDRVCRGLIEQMKSNLLIEIDQQKDRADRRTKTVTVTDCGWESLRDLTQRLSLLTSEQSVRVSKRQAA